MSRFGVSQAMRVILVIAAAILFALASPTSAAKPKTRDGSLPASLAKSIASSSTGILQLNSNTYEALTKHPRDYAVVAVLTAVDSGVDCPPCRSFDPEFKAVAASWKKAKGKKGQSWSGKDIVFGSLEFKDGREIFQKAGLSHAPVMFAFPPSNSEQGAAPPGSFDFNRRGFQADEVADWLSSQFGHKVPYTKPLPWLAISLFAGSAIAVALSVFLLWPKLVKLQDSAWGSSSGTSGSATPVTFSSIIRFACMCISLAIITIMCSGHMWNNIRNAPYAGRGGDGSTQWISPGFQNQFAAETQIVAGFYGLLAFSFISLTIFVPAQKDPIRQRAGVYVWSAVFLATFSLLFAIFRLKNPSYPFRLFF